MSARKVADEDVPAVSKLRVDRGGTVLVFPSSVVVAGMDASGQISLVRQFRVAAGRQTLELPGGKIDAGEAPEEAARREFTEETGLRCSGLKRLFTLDMDFSVSRHKTHVFQAVVKAGHAKKGAFEIVSLSLARALQMVKRGSVTHAPTVAAILWLTNHPRVDS